jgi:hypothetical protein
MSELCKKRRMDANQIDRPQNTGDIRPRMGDNISFASSHADGPPRPSSFWGSPIIMFLDFDDMVISKPVAPVHVPSSSSSFSSADQEPAMHTLVEGLQDMFHRQIAATQEDRDDRHHFEHKLKALLAPAPVLSVTPVIHDPPDQLIQGQYYPAPPPESVSSATIPRPQVFHQSLPQFSMHYEPPFLAPPTKFTHCSKFKTQLDTSGKVVLIH